MSPIKLDTLDSEKITVEAPQKNENLYLAELKYDSNSFIIQSKRLQIANVDVDSIDFYVPQDDINFFKKIDKFLINKIAVNSESWFGKCIPPEKVTKIYKRTIRDSLDNDNYLLTLKLNDNLRIYSKDISDLNYSDLKVNSEVIILFTIPYLVFYKTNCIPYCEVLQIKIKEKKTLLQFRSDIDSETNKKSVNIKLDEFNFN